MRRILRRRLHLLLPWLLLAYLPCAHAGVNLKVEGVSGDLHHAVVAGVELSQYGKRNVSAAQVHRLYANAPDEVRAALKPYGYYDVGVDSSLSQQGQTWTVVLKVMPGKPVRVSKVDIQVPDRAAKLRPVKKAIAGFKPAKGDILNDATYTHSRDAISAALTQTGFLDAKMTVHRVAVHRADHRAVVNLAWKVGQRYRFGQVHFQGSQFEKGFLQRYVPFKQGDYFDQTQLLALQQALIGADYFSVVNVQPQFKQATHGTVDIDVQLKPAKRSVYTGGPFIGTDTGLGIRLGLKRRWVNNKGHKWDNELVLAQRLKTLTSLYQIPLPGPHDKSLNFGANVRDANTRTSKSRTLELVASESQEWHGWLRTAGLHYLVGTFTVGQHAREPASAAGIEHGRSQLLYPQVSFARKQGAGENFVRHGWSMDLTARSSAGTLLSDTRFLQLLADAKWIDAFTQRDRLILRGSAGATKVGNFHALPPQLRFFAGGSESVRGYGYQALGPTNSYGRVIGGRNLLVASATVEHYFVPHWGIAFFVDAGNAFNGRHITPRIGSGLGLRWRSPLGMIRLDLGVPVNDPYKHGVQLHLEIGPDL